MGTGNILISAIDNIAGQGVGGVGTLFSGNVGQVVVAFIAISLAGAAIGAFFYLKSKVSSANG